MSCDDAAEVILGAEDGALHTPCCSALGRGCPGRGWGLGSGFLLSWGDPLRGLTRASESSVPGVLPSRRGAGRIPASTTHSIKGDQNGVSILTPHHPLLLLSSWSLSI